MYLTRLRLDPRSAQARRDLADPYDMHRSLVRAFVAGPEQAAPRFLWRQEPASHPGDAVLLVQSTAPGDWAAMAAQPNYLKTDPEQRSLCPAHWLEADASFRFRLYANPTVTRDGKRYALLAEEAQLTWLARQGERHGFAVDVALVTGSHWLHGRKGQSRISLLRVAFEGRLRVQDATALDKAMAAGIGPGKAFGCGLLSLARADQVTGA